MRRIHFPFQSFESFTFVHIPTQGYFFGFMNLIVTEDRLQRERIFEKNLVTREVSDLCLRWCRHWSISIRSNVLMVRRRVQDGKVVSPDLCLDRSVLWWEYALVAVVLFSTETTRSEKMHALDSVTGEYYCFIVKWNIVFIIAKGDDRFPHGFQGVLTKESDTIFSFSHGDEMSTCIERSVLSMNAQRERQCSLPRIIKGWPSIPISFSVWMTWNVQQRSTLTRWTHLWHAETVIR